MREKMMPVECETELPDGVSIKSEDVHKDVKNKDFFEISLSHTRNNNFQNLKCTNGLKSFEKVYDDDDEFFERHNVENQCFEGSENERIDLDVHANIVKQGHQILSSENISPIVSGQSSGSSPADPNDFFMLGDDHKFVETSSSTFDASFHISSEGTDHPNQGIYTVHEFEDEFENHLTPTPCPNHQRKENIVLSVDMKKCEVEAPFNKDESSLNKNKKLQWQQDSPTKNLTVFAMTDDSDNTDNEFTSRASKKGITTLVNSPEVKQQEYQRIIRGSQKNFGQKHKPHNFKQMQKTENTSFTDARICVMNDYSKTLDQSHSPIQLDAYEGNEKIEFFSMSPPDAVKGVYNGEETFHNEITSVTPIVFADEISTIHENDSEYSKDKCIKSEEKEVPILALNTQHCIEENSWKDIEHTSEVPACGKIDIVSVENSTNSDDCSKNVLTAKPEPVFPFPGRPRCVRPYAIARDSVPAFHSSEIVKGKSHFAESHCSLSESLKNENRSFADQNIASGVCQNIKGESHQSITHTSDTTIMVPPSTIQDFESSPCPVDSLNSQRRTKIRFISTNWTTQKSQETQSEDGTNLKVDFPNLNNETAEVSKSDSQTVDTSNESNDAKAKISNEPCKSIKQTLSYHIGLSLCSTNAGTSLQSITSNKFGSPSSLNVGVNKETCRSSLDFAGKTYKSSVNTCRDYIRPGCVPHLDLSRVHEKAGISQELRLEDEFSNHNGEHSGPGFPLEDSDDDEFTNENPFSHTDSRFPVTARLVRCTQYLFTARVSNALQMCLQQEEENRRARKGRSNDKKLQNKKYGFTSAPSSTKTSAANSTEKPDVVDHRRTHLVNKNENESCSQRKLKSSVSVSSRRCTKPKMLLKGRRLTLHFSRKKETDNEFEGVECSTNINSGVNTDNPGQSNKVKNVKKEPSTKDDLERPPGNNLLQCKMQEHNIGRRNSSQIHKTQPTSCNSTFKSTNTRVSQKGITTVDLDENATSSNEENDGDDSVNSSFSGCGSEETKFTGIGQDANILNETKQSKCQSEANRREFKTDNSEIFAGFFVHDDVKTLTSQNKKTLRNFSTSYALQQEDKKRRPKQHNTKFSQKKRREMSAAQRNQSGRYTTLQPSASISSKRHIQALKKASIHTNGINALSSANSIFSAAETLLQPYVSSVVTI